MAVACEALLKERPQRVTLRFWRMRYSRPGKRACEALRRHSSVAKRSAFRTGWVVISISISLPRNLNDSSGATRARREPHNDHFGVIRTPFPCETSWGRKGFWTTRTKFSSSFEQRANPGQWGRNLKILRSCTSPLNAILGTQVLDILLRHLVSNVIRLPNRERDNRQCGIFRCAGCELAAVRNE